MENFARLLAAAGILFAGFSVLLMQYLSVDTAEYTMSKVNILLGVLMFACGILYLILKANKNK